MRRERRIKMPREPRICFALPCAASESLSDRLSRKNLTTGLRARARMAVTCANIAIFNPLSDAALLAPSDFSRIRGSIDVSTAARLMIAINNPTKKFMPEEINRGRLPVIFDKTPER